jgi:uncharacterized Zn ribbon protein
VSALIVGLQSRPELNGISVCVLHYVYSKKRYTVEIQHQAEKNDKDQETKQEKEDANKENVEDSDDKQTVLLNLKPTNLILKEGTTVLMCNLTACCSRAERAPGDDFGVRQRQKPVHCARPRRKEPEACAAGLRRCGFPWPPGCPLIAH